MQNNLIWSCVHIWETLSPKLLAKVTAEVGIQAHGPAPYLALIIILKLGASYERLEKTKRNLFALSLKNIPGEKIPDISLKMKTFVD